MNDQIAKIVGVKPTWITTGRLRARPTLRVVKK